MKRLLTMLITLLVLVGLATPALAQDSGDAVDRGPLVTLITVVVVVIVLVVVYVVVMRQNLTFRQRRLTELAGRMALILVAVFYAIFPVLFIFSSSVNPSGNVLGQGILPDPSRFYTGHYEDLLCLNTEPRAEDTAQQERIRTERRSRCENSMQFPRWVLNSLYISTTTSILSVLISSLSAYAFSRFRFRGRRNLLLTIFLIQVFPNSLAMVAIFLLLQTIGNIIPALGLNTHGGLILVYLGGALGINTWLMKGFFDTIPRELDESAQIDGATDWQIFWQIIFPLVRPILAVVGILTFIGTYGDFILPLVLIREPSQYTVALGLSIFIGDQFSQNWGIFAAGALLGALPIVAMYIILQDYIVGGLTAGAVKG